MFPPVGFHTTEFSIKTLIEESGANSAEKFSKAIRTIYMEEIIYE